MGPEALSLMQQIINILSIPIISAFLCVSSVKKCCGFFKQNSNVGNGILYPIYQSIGQLLMYDQVQIRMESVFARQKSLHGTNNKNREVDMSYRTHISKLGDVSDRFLD